MDREEMVPEDSRLEEYLKRFVPVEPQEEIDEEILSDARRILENGEGKGVRPVILLLLSSVPVAAAAIVVFLAIAFLGNRTPPASKGSAWKVSGRVLSGEKAEPFIGSNLEKGIAVHALGPVFVSGPYGSTLQVSKGSLLVLPPVDASPEEALHLRLLRGGLEGNIKKGDAAQGKKVPFRLTTPAAEIVAEGTKFSVQLHEKGGSQKAAGRVAALVALYSGALLVKNPHGMLRMLPGDVAYADEENAPVRAVKGLSQRFGSLYEPVSVPCKPSVPAYRLPLESEKVGNYEFVLKKLSEHSIALDERLLKENGFVGAEFCRCDDFGEAYEILREMKAPVFVTSDTVLHLYHLIFDKILMGIEEKEILPQLSALCKGILDSLLEQNLHAEGKEKSAIEKAAAFLAVGYELLSPETLSLPQDIRILVDHDRTAALRSTGFAESKIFNYEEDFSQYLPRGHYTRSEELKGYFRAMMWFGRMVFLVRGAEPDRLGSEGLVSHDEAELQTLAACYLTDALRKGRIKGVPAKEVWERIYHVTSFFAGLSEDLTVEEYDRTLVEMFGEEYAPGMLGREENRVRFKAAIARLKRPSIYSGTAAAVIPSAGQGAPEEAERALRMTQGVRFMGQRFTPDSYVMAQITFPAVGSYVGERFGSQVFTHHRNQRAFPRGLDVMALLGSQRAEEILAAGGDSAYRGYGDALRNLQGEFSEIADPEEWNRNLYWSWLYCIKSLLKEYPEGYPTYMTTKAWQDKALNTALSSWAELRHDTLLYVKQAYPEEEKVEPKIRKPEDFPDCVEPMPELYGRLLALTRLTRIVLSQMEVLGEDDALRLQWADDCFSRLVEISRKELENQFLSQEDLDWIREFDRTLKWICCGSEDSRTTLIADVYTDPNSGQVLEVGNGFIGIAVVAHPLPDGAIGLAVGPVFSYHEFKHPLEDRLTDEKWREMLRSARGNIPGKRPEFIKSFWSSR